MNRATPKYYVFPGINNDRVISEKIMRLSPEEIIKVIADYFEITAVNIRNKERYRKFAYPRHISIYFMKKYGLMASTQIGRILNRDHTTILHSLDIVKNWIDTKDEMIDKINDLKNIFCSK